MNIKNNKKAYRFLTIVTTLLFAVSVFTVAAFATEPSTSQPEAPTSKSSSSASQTAEGTSSPVETPPGDSSNSSGLEEGTGGNVPDEQQPTGSSSDTSSVDSSASSTVSSEEAPTSAKPKPPVNQKPVDTQAQRVEAIASQAEQATSDPDVLSSQNWSELLSSGSNSQPQGSSAAGDVSDSTSSQSADSSGGISWLLIAGIILIVLSLCGIAFFIYEQFIKDKDDRFGGPRDISSRSSGKPTRKDPESTGFVDISSNSDGHVGESGLDSISIPAAKTTTAAPQAPAKPVRQPEVPAEPKTPAKPEAPAVPPVQEAVKPQPEVTEPAAPAVQERPLDSKAPTPEQAKEDLPKSQATPVTESDFNWEKFFNEDEKK